MTSVPIRPGRPVPRETCRVCGRPYARGAWVPRDRTCRDCRAAKAAADKAAADKKLRQTPPLF